MNTDTSKLISVIMPAYNAERFIADSIRSVIDQTYTDWELIIIDDGSSDRTRETVLEYQQNEPRISYYHQENKRQGAARNKGISLAKGELVAFLDADDRFLPNMLEEQLDLIEAKGADLVFSSIIYVDEKGDELSAKHTVNCRELIGLSGAEYLLRNDNPIPIITVLARKRRLIDAGCFKEAARLQFGEEYDLWVRMLLQNSKFVYNVKPLAVYVIHVNQSSKVVPDKYFQILEMIASLPVTKCFEAERKIVSSIWIRRCLRFSTDLDRQKIRRIIRYLPWSGKPVIYLFSYLLPLSILKKTVYKLTHPVQKPASVIQ